ncbi:hypothetical protein J1N35_000544 [Gossypium stocksii]|uniref:Uncharacterized protein n=1 Tax=Gossypium stocksii TaxID=47602 RepID=A0A9D4AKL4_9ROSI|nr:hypothetical protein J1N35_000544 [Gossypium stocksii]
MQICGVRLLSYKYVILGAQFQSKSIEIKKGLINVLNEWFPDLEHRVCARYIYVNWQKTWKGLNRKVQFWNCARSTFVEDFDHQLQKLKVMGETSTDK